MPTPLRTHSGAALPAGLHAALQSKIPSASLMRKIVLEGHRFGGEEALGYDLVDVLAPKKGEEGGPATTLKVAIELATKFAPKATKGAYGTNKVSCGIGSCQREAPLTAPSTRRTSSMLPSSPLCVASEYLVPKAALT